MPSPSQVKSTGLERFVHAAKTWPSHLVQMADRLCMDAQDCLYTKRKAIWYKRVFFEENHAMICHVYNDAEFVNDSRHISLVSGGIEDTSQVYHSLQRHFVTRNCMQGRVTVT